MPDRPVRMRRNGRPEDQVFERVERLFRRYAQMHYINGHFSNHGFSFDSPPSVNREKYSEPADVLFPDEFADWGVLSFTVADVPSQLPDTDPQFTFWAKHRPLEDNCSHSEVWSDKISATGDYVKPTPAVRKLFRTMLSQRVVIEIAARI